MDREARLKHTPSLLPHIFDGVPSLLRRQVSQVEPGMSGEGDILSFSQ